MKIRRWLGSVLLVSSPLIVVFLAHGAPPMLNWAYAAFLMGTFIELLLLAGDPKEAGINAALALGFTALTFIMGRDAIIWWPLSFAMVLLIITAGRFHRSLTSRIGEGTALLASLAFVAWMLDGFVNGEGSPVPLVLAIIPILFSLVYALTSLPLTRPIRLVMSLWTAAVVAALSIRYFYAVMALGTVESRFASGDWVDALSVFAEFLLLGASGPILLQNFILLAPYLPSRKHFFDKKYREEAAQATREHIERVSAERVSLPQVAGAILIAVALLALQGILHALSIDFVIWFLLAGVPWIMNAWTSWRPTSLKPESASP